MCMKYTKCTVLKLNISNEDASNKLSTLISINALVGSYPRGLVEALEAVAADVKEGNNARGRIGTDTTHAAYILATPNAYRALQTGEWGHRCISVSGTKRHPNPATEK